MFGGDDDDGPLPVKGSAKGGGASKLSSLFAAEENLTSASSQSLGYTAKKSKSAQQLPAAALPQQSSAAAGQTAVATAVAPSAPVVIFATLVNLLRYDASNTAVAVGQRAVAILKTGTANPAVSMHVLVAYEPSSQRQDFIVALAESFNLTAAPPAYVMLYDDNRQYWCMQLALDQLDALLKHVAMAKHAQAAQSNQAHPPLIIQDLTAATTDRPASAGDTLKLKYTMHLTAPTHPKGLGGLVGNVGSDEKPKQVKVGGKKELAGIEQGVVGLRKGGRRFLVIPPYLAYGGQQAGSIPPQSTLLVEVTCIKVKYADGHAPTPSPSAAPSLPAATAPAVSPAAEGAGGGGSVPGGVTVPSIMVVDDEDDGQRNRLAHKMASMGFKMPGLPGAVDPDHLAARQAEERRRNSVDSREGLSQPPSPALSSVSVATSAPSLSLQSPMSQPGHVPSLPSLSIPHPSSLQPAQQAQQAQPSPYYQQQPPSTPYYQQPQQPQQQQPQHSSMQQPSQPYSSFASPSHQYNSSGYGYEGAPHYASAGTPSQSHHISPVQTPHPSYPYTSHPGHHHSNSLSHTANFQQQQQQQQQPQQMSSLSSPLLAAIDSKLDALQVSIAQSNRILGTANSSLLYESPLSGAQLIRALNSLLQERDDARSKAEASERRNTELTAKLSAMQERYEKNSEDNSRMMERRYEQYADELKTKNAHIVELQAGVRRAEHEAQQAALVKVEAESEVARLREALAKEKEESRGRAEAERQVIMLQLQLKQTAEAVEGKEQESKLVMQQRITEKESEIAGMRHEAERRQAEDERERAVLQQTIDTLKQQMAHSQQQADNTIAELHAAAAQTSEERTRLQGELDRLHAQLDHMQQNTVSAAEHQALQTQLTALQEQLRQAQRETEEAREETANIIAEARSRREQDKQAMLAAIEQARTDEYERGQQETLDEARQSMQTMKDKARATIEQLAAEKEQLEERLKGAEEERQEVIDSSRAYIERMKAQMTARLAEVEGKDGVSEERLEEEKAVALKAVYGGVSRVLQQYGEKRWRAAEMAMVLRAEVQFVLSGERPEVNIEQDEERQEEVKEVEKVAVVQERLHELSTEREEAGDHDSSTKADETAAIGDDDSSRVQSAAVEEQKAVSSEHDTAEHDNGTSHIDKEDGALQQHIEAESNNTDADETQQPQHAQQLERVEEPSTDDSAGEAVPEHPAVISTAPLLPPGAADSAETEAPIAPAAAVQDVDAADTAPGTAQNGTSLPLSDEVNPSESNGVNIAGTFEYPADGPKQSDTAQSVNQQSSQPTAAVSDQAAVDETEDELAPLPTHAVSPPLTVDPSAAAYNVIAPPTPTVLTPPANTHVHGYPANPPAASSTVTSAAASPTAAAAPAKLERGSISDPFADPFADDVATTSPARSPAPAAVKPTVPLKPNAALPSNPLFADDDDDDLLFASGAPKPKPATAASKPAAVKRTSLFGDDDDDDDPLFK